MSENEDSCDNLNYMLSTFAANLVQIIRQAENFAQEKTKGDSGLVISIEAPWGMGKTFFLDYFMSKIKDCGGCISPNVFLDTRQEEISVRRPADEESVEVIPISYNAWEDDYVDPFVSLVGQLCEKTQQINPVKAKKLKSAAKVMAKSLIEAAKDIPVVGFKVSVAEKFGNGVLDVCRESKSRIFDDEIEKYDMLKKNREKFKIALEDYGEEKTKVICIDELDRCAPEFTIKMLETLKHFFNAKNTVFILAIDREAICAHIKHFYGNDIDAQYYLSRFFDVELEIPYPENFVDKLIDNRLMNNQDKVTADYQNLLSFLIKQQTPKITPRELVKIYKYIDLLDAFDPTASFEYVPLLVLKVNNRDKFNEVIRFKIDDSPAGEVIEKFVSYFGMTLLSQPEHFIGKLLVILVYILRNNCPQNEEIIVDHIKNNCSKCIWNEFNRILDNSSMTSSSLNKLLLFINSCMSTNRLCGVQY